MSYDASPSLFWKGLSIFAFGLGIYTVALLTPKTSTVIQKRHS